MAATTIKLSTDVKNIVDKLEDLGKQLRENRYLFAEEFGASANSVISAMKELDKIRVHAHQLLEGETIMASALRHKLNTHVSKLQAEAAAAVISARQSNQARLSELQTQVTLMSEEASSLLKRHEVVGLHNDVLLPQLKQLQAAHSDKVKILNEKMLERAGMQIFLNETIEQLDDTGSKILDIEEEIHILQDNLKLKRQHISKEREELLKSLEGTKMQLNQQNEENRDLKNDLHVEEYESAQVELSVKESVASIENVKREISSLIVTQNQLKSEAMSKEVEKRSLIQDGERIKKDMELFGYQHSVKKKQAEEIINQLIAEVELADTESKKLKDVYKAVKSEWKVANEDYDSISYSLNAVKESVASAKESLMRESEEGVKLETEKNELEFRLTQIQETHKVNVQLFKEEITEYKDKLAHEHKIRQSAEENYKDLELLIQQQLLDQSEIMTTLNMKLKESKKAGDTLHSKIVTLDNSISQCETSIERLNKEISERKSHLSRRSTQLEEQLNILEESIAELTDDIKDATDQLLEAEPLRDSLEEEYASAMEEYEESKRIMIELKNKRSGLSDACQRLERELEKIHIPQAHLRMETLRCRTYARKNLRERKVIVDDLEEKLREKRTKLNTILFHNDRIREASKKLEKECNGYASYSEGSAEREKRLIGRLEQMKTDLEKQWQESKELAKVYHERDSGIVETLTSLQEKSSKQMKELSVVSSQFTQEMNIFNKFLLRLSKRKK
ncbi:PREDICTED: coiled-coil domain-containing protein 18-like [Amphimedon queenslandica]|uniref:Uncharacterized protein n=1 Tax=Amphimedon queenslandica TaxID=400682 RepID=A0A1X7V4T0_AMPQE|nr:PREDICTED: coiled-coil domain-containing protein 18-like [Amphimedon queenslandica]|eukprot:XP_019850554.1 PREDICTED: coiled-coil domain-containing protein 18-like [Amphimedon queenslandica]